MGSFHVLLVDDEVPFLEALAAAAKGEPDRS